MSDFIDLETDILTETGHPIGHLVVADGTSVPNPVSEETARENREELMRMAASELADTPDSDSAVLELYPGYDDPEKRKSAMVMYVAEGRPIDEIAEKVGVPGRTVAMWMYNGQWDVLAKKEVVARQAQSVIDLARLRAQKRIDIAREQFDQARTIRNRAMDRIRADEGSLKSNSEAWSVAAKIEHTLSGMSEAGAVVGVDQESDKATPQGKQPLVMVFQGGLPPVRRHE